MKKILLVLVFLVTNLQASEIQLRHAPLQEFIEQIYVQTGKSVIVPSDINPFLNMYLKPNLTQSELLNIFKNSVINSGLTYKEFGDTIYIDTRSEDVSMFMQPITFDVSLNLEVLDFLPNGSKMYVGNSQTVIYTNKEYFPILHKIAGNTKYHLSNYTTKVYKSLSAKPSTYLDLQTDNLTLKALDSLNRLVATGLREEIAKFDTLINTLESSLSTYVVDMFIVSSSEDFNKKYNLDLTVGSDLLSLGLSGFFTANYGTPFTAAKNATFLFNFIKSNRYLSIVEKPHVMLLDGKSTRLTVGQEVPFETQSFDPQGSISTIQTTERKDVGLILDISANSLMDGKVRLNIDQQLSSISTQQLERSVDLITDKQSYQTTLDVELNKFYLVGGLSYKDKYKQVDRNPIFEDLGILDELTTNTDSQSSSRDLLLFIQVRNSSEFQAQNRASDSGSALH